MSARPPSHAANHPGYDAEVASFFTDYGDQISSRNIVGKLLKFNKGDFLAGEQNIEIPPKTRFIANMDQFLIGWIRWDAKKPLEQHMGLIVDGYQPAKRDALGYGYEPGDKAEDADDSEWETDDKGNTRDPWQFSNYVVLKDPLEKDHDESLYTFATSSRGGLSALGDLCKVYGRQMRHRPNHYPVIELLIGSYNHREYGRTKIPVFRVVDWVEKSAFGEMLALSAPQRNEEEEIPF